VTYNEDTRSLRIVKSNLRYVVDDSGRGGCMMTGTSATRTLLSGPENFCPSTGHAPKPAVICVAAGENHPSPKAAVRLTDRRAAAADTPLLSATAAQQCVSRGQDPAVVFAAAEKITALGSVLHGAPLAWRSGVTSAPLIWRAA
jgi:hypothetical protein